MDLSAKSNCECPLMNAMNSCALSVLDLSERRVSECRWSVDDRFPLSFYVRIADQLLKQAAVYREEGSLDYLQLTLGRYVRLVSEVIPQHRNYSKHSSKEKLKHKKILQESTKEIEKLKLLMSVKSNVGGERRDRNCKHNLDGFRSLSERWTKKILRLPSFKEGEDERSSSTRTSQSGSDNEAHVVKHYFPSPVVSWVEDGSYSRQVSYVIVPESNNENSEPTHGQSSTSNSTQQVQTSVKLTEEFLNIAKENTDKDLETCGILGAFLKNGTFYITTLIVPKHESTSNSSIYLKDYRILLRSIFYKWQCQASNEEEIHTHPSHTCFLSSIDLHTQYSYQVMLPEAIAIVMAPTDPTRACGIFRLTDPGGIAVLKECKERGFHQHPASADGSPIYEICSNIYPNSNLRFEIIDLRSYS